MDSREIYKKILQQKDIYDTEFKEKQEQELKQQEFKIKQLKENYKNVFNSQEGISILNDLMHKSGYFLTSVNRARTENGTVDPLQLAYLDGRRSLFCEIANFLTTELLIKVKDYGTNE